MKNIFKVLIGVFILIVLIIAVKIVPLGTKKMTLGATIISIEVPKLSSLDSECCEYKATFKTIRGIKKKKKDFDSIMSKYQKVICNGISYYYDKENNITYKEITYEGGLLFNTYNISYVKDNICEK